MSRSQELHVGRRPGDETTDVKKCFEVKVLNTTKKDRENNISVIIEFFII